MAEKYIEEALENFLRTNVNITATAISTRSYWEEAPNQNALTLPYCVFTEASDTMEEFALQKGNTSRPRLSITVYSLNKTDKSIIRVILNELRGFIGTFGGILIEDSNVTAMREFKEPETNIWNFGFDWIPVYELNQ